MNIHEQIKHDVELLSENDITQSQLVIFLKDLKEKIHSPRNVDRVLAHAGCIDNKSAAEVTHIINSEFGKIDNQWD